jgi:hypothetical protein
MWKMTVHTIKGGFEETIVKDIRTKIYDRNENVLLIFVGRPRKGKSLCTIQTLHKIDHNFDTKTVCAFELEKFFQILDDEKTTMKAVMCEEFGLKADRRNFMTKTNKYLRQYWQVSGYRANCIALTVPSMLYIDSGIEPLVDYVFDAVKAWKRKVNGKSHLIKARFNVLKFQHNAISTKTYKKHPPFWVRNRMRKIGTCTIHAPPEDVICRYLEDSIPYKERVSKEKSKQINLDVAGIIEKKESFIDKQRQTTDALVDDLARSVIDTVPEYSTIGYRSIVKMFGKSHKIGEGRARKIAEKIKNIINTKNASNLVDAAAGVHSV